jgi:hypothetical protein
MLICGTSLLLGVWHGPGANCVIHTVTVPSERWVVPMWPSLVRADPQVALRDARQVRRELTGSMTPTCCRMGMLIIGTTRVAPTPG